MLPLDTQDAFHIVLASGSLDVGPSVTTAATVLLLSTLLDCLEVRLEQIIVCPDLVRWSFIVGEFVEGDVGEAGEQCVEVGVGQVGEIVYAFRQ